MRQLLTFSNRPLVEFPHWFDVTLWVLFVVSGLGLIQTLWMRRRIRRVAEFRFDMLRLIHATSLMDHELGLDAQWRLEVFESVTFAQMMRRFWRPLKVSVWYPDLSFIMPPTEALKIIDQVHEETHKDDQANAEAECGR